MFGISDNSTTRLIYLTLEISLPCGSVHCWHSFLLLIVLQLQNRAYACLEIFPQYNSKPAKALFVVFCHVVGLPAAGKAVECTRLSAPTQLCSEGQRQRSWLLLIKTPWRFLKHSNVYNSTPAVFLPHKNHPEIAVWFIYSLSLQKHDCSIADKG